MPGFFIATKKPRRTCRGSFGQPCCWLAEVETLRKTVGYLSYSAQRFFSIAASASIPSGNIWLLVQLQTWQAVLSPCTITCFLINANTGAGTKLTARRRPLAVNTATDRFPHLAHQGNAAWAGIIGSTHAHDGGGFLISQPCRNAATRLGIQFGVMKTHPKGSTTGTTTLTDVLLGLGHTDKPEIQVGTVCL